MEREVSEVDRKLLLKKTYLDKIAYFINRNPISQDELYSTVRRFFSELLKLDYEFTYEELSQELNKVFIKSKVKEKIDDFLIRLSESEYLGETDLGTSGINAFLIELSEIIQNVIYDDKSPHEDATIVQKVLKIASKSSEKLINVSSMTSAIEEINFHITSGNIDTAKKLYVELLKNYDTLNREDKKKLHEDMNEVYERLQTLMKNPKAKVTMVSKSISDSAQTVKDMCEETALFISASNLTSAKKSYNNALTLYDTLSLDEKKSLHPKINELYEKLQTLSSMSGKMTPDNISTDKINANKTDNNAIDSTNQVNTESKSSSQVTSNIRTAVSTNALTSNNISVDTPINTSVNAPISTATEVTGATATGRDLTYGSEASSFNFDVDISNKSSAASYDSNTASDGLFVQPPKNISTTSISSATSSNNGNNNAPKLSTQSNIRTDVVSLSKAIPASNSQVINDTSSHTPMSVLPDDNNVLFTFNGTTPIYQSKNDTLKNDAQKNDAFTNTKYSTSVGFNFDEKKSESMTSESKPVTSYSEPITSKFVSESESFSASTPITSFASSPVSSPVVQTPIIFSNDKSNNWSSDTSTIDTNNTIPTTEIDSQIVPRIISDSKIAPRVIPQMILKTVPTMGLKDVSDSSRNIYPDVALTKLDLLLRKINEDVLMEKIDKAKESYKDALSMYKDMDNSDKARYYNVLNSTFKKIDALSHQKLLHELLDTHLSRSKNSQRPMRSVNKSPNKDGSLDIKSDVKSSVALDKKHSKINPLIQSNNTALPVIINNDIDTARVYELIEESYFNMDNDNLDLAMLKYFKALDNYRNLPLTDKRKIYSDIYALFTKLSHVKRNMLINSA